MQPGPPTLPCLPAALQVDHVAGVVLGLAYLITTILIFTLQHGEQAPEGQRLQGCLADERELRASYWPSTHLRCGMCSLRHSRVGTGCPSACPLLLCRPGLACMLAKQPVCHAVVICALTAACAYRCCLPACLPAGYVNVFE